MYSRQVITYIFLFILNNSYSQEKHYAIQRIGEFDFNGNISEFEQIEYGENGNKITNANSFKAFLNKKGNFEKIISYSNIKKDTSSITTYFNTKPKYIKDYIIPGYPNSSYKSTLDSRNNKIVRNYNINNRKTIFTFNKDEKLISKITDSDISTKQIESWEYDNQKIIMNSKLGYNCKVVSYQYKNNKLFKISRNVNNCEDINKFELNNLYETFIFYNKNDSIVTKRHLNKLKDSAIYRNQKLIYRIQKGNNHQFSKTYKYEGEKLMQSDLYSQGFLTERIKYNYDKYGNKTLVLNINGNSYKTDYIYDYKNNWIESKLYKNNKLLVRKIRNIKYRD